MNSSPKMNFDLKIDISLLDRKSRLKFIEEVYNDGFNYICLTQTIPISQNCQPVEIDPLPHLKDLRIFRRINLKIQENTEIKNMKSKSEQFSKFDLISLEFNSADLLEFFLQTNTEFGDNLIFFDLKTFVFTPTLFKMLKSTSFFLEFGYSDVIDVNNRKQALVGMYKLLDSMNKKVVMSSNSRSLLEHRTVDDLKDFLIGVTENSKAKATGLLKKLITDNPVDVLKRAKLKREGFVSEINN